MNTILSPQKGDNGKNRDSSEEIQESIYTFQHEVNATDGSEFLDDKIRMKDQPIGKTSANENE